MTIIKICGMTNKADALAASDLGVEMIGFVFYGKSKRYIAPRTARDISSELPPSVSKVGIFVDEDKNSVLDIAEDVVLDILQFHGCESPGYCAVFRDSYKIIKAFRIRERNDLVKVNDYDVDYYLFDSYLEGVPGGTGKAMNRKLLDGFEFLKPVIISGGLTPENVARAIREVSPYGVDVSSGVELSPGSKDLKLMKKFVENVRRTR
jgi:phosphoribosylanthranilate isomerase